MSEWQLPAVLIRGPRARAAVPPDEIRAFYDQHIVEKVADFVDGNPRVDAAWNTIAQWAPPAPRAILEVGCGFGQISWRLATRWPGAQVTGFDISPRSIELASAVFQRGNLGFASGRLDELGQQSGYDLIVLVDVYEHIASHERAHFNAAVARLLAADGRLVLTFPTPAYQALLRACHPDKLQPVDEDIEIRALQNLAAATRTRLQMYREHSIWRTGDYAHAVLGRGASSDPVEQADARPAFVGAIERVRRKLRSLSGRENLESREARLRLIARSLGPGLYRPR